MFSGPKGLHYTIKVIIYDDSLLGDRAKSSFPRMHMAYSSYAPCNSSVLATFSPFSCFRFLFGGQHWSGQTKGCQTLYSKQSTNLVAGKIFTFSNRLIYNQILAWFIVFEFTCLVIQRQLFSPSSLSRVTQSKKKFCKINSHNLKMQLGFKCFFCKTKCFSLWLVRKSYCGW